MAQYKLVDTQQLEEDLTLVADAIRERSGTTALLAFPQGMAEEVKSIPSSGTDLPELTDPGTAADLALDKQLLDPDGQIVTGTLAQIASGYAISAKDNPTVASSASTGIRIKAQSNSGDYILRSGAYLIASAPAESFGDADAADVAKGKTFTSAAGLLVEGTHEWEGGITLPALTNPAGASDIVSGKALYDADGNLVAGDLYEVLEGRVIAAHDYLRLLESNGTIQTLATMSTGDAVVRKNAIFRATAPADAFGTATPGQVAKGATFTSAAGLLVEGTHEWEGGVTLPALENPAAASDLASGKQLIDEDGNVVTGSLADMVSGKRLVASEDPITGHYTTTNAVINMATFSGNCIARSGVKLMVYIPAEQYGNAAAADVAKGKTFTSAAGLLVEGTMEASGGQTGFIRMLERTSGDLTVPEGCTAIGDYAFYYNSALTGLTLPDTVTKIGYRSFYQCTALAQLQLPAGLDTIDSQAFYNCRELTGLTFRSTPSSIANNAFGACSNLTVINVPWASGAVANAPWGAVNATINYNCSGSQ